MTPARQFANTLAIVAATIFWLAVKLARAPFHPTRDDHA